ncbi:TIGR02302 family protein [Pseudaestuariivita atlantica]|uniref:ATPase n=1 Tax=Pseudaestuariivita atlantica TaxID=1317121 RepID=A0A0L1JRL8_9RHOB|nr:TIGR02302 family protein [Pseudaestuariivita atlantica]KNG94400.1 ATPase [Pseudaestuariivita atlantica]
MTRPVSTPRLFKRLAWPLGLTRAGMLCEALVRAFWPLWSVAILATGLLMLGVHELMSVELVWAIACLVVAGALFGLWYGARRFRWPSRDDAIRRLDATMKGRPLAALMDEQAIGQGDDHSEAVWRAHRARMADRAAAAQPVRPDLRISALDPFGLRYSALLVLAVALLFGSISRVGSVTELAPGTQVTAGGPAWEGWVEPPGYTGKPTLYLADQAGEIRAPQGATITLRFYGDASDLTLRETISGTPVASDDAQAAENTAITIAQSGRLDIAGPGGQSWNVVMEPDRAPRVSISAEPESEADGRMLQRFVARDDYGIIGGTGTIRLNLDAVDRRYGLATDPEPREEVIVDLPLPIAGDRSDFEETIVENFSQHPWANLPVTLTLEVTDELGQTGQSTDFRMTLPGRRFFDPMAAAVIEQRRDLLWSRDNAPRIAQILRAVSHRAESAFRSETAYLRLRVILRRLETFTEFGITDDQQAEIAEALWDLAILLEEGDLSDALERLRRAQERLSEAIRNGATDEEIAELMQELRDASRDYINQLAQQNRQDGQQNSDQAQNQQGDSMQMTQDDLQAMMDRIQELMEQGRMAEAQQALEELQQLMENMRVTESQQGGGQSPGQQAMEGLAETLRDQQGLSDDAFRDLQEQFNPNAQAGENEGNEGRDGGQGRGQQHSQQQGQGEGQGQQPGQQGGGQEQGEGQGEGGDQRQSLADRQRALRGELQRQQNALPNVGGEAGDAAREALRRADRAMDGAEQSLRQDDLAGAIDQQSEAMEALREGMRNLGEALAEQQRQQEGQQGTADADTGQERRDPLGRRQGTNGQIGTQEQLLQGEDVYRRARELLDEIRRRTGESSRPELEREYLERLLDRY